MPANYFDNGGSTKRFETALSLATKLHAQQTRKNTTTPYLAHLLGVASLVMEDGGDEDEAIAALLHDAVEDQGGLLILEDIRSIFGENVANIVMGCTDAVSEPKPPWRARKEEYLQDLREAPEAVLRVSLADKLHNARCILSDLRYGGDDIWRRFNGGKVGTLWYYHSLAAIFMIRTDSPMSHELMLTIDEIDKIATENS
jgi:(p)ppGpp synthase/HD superfamily hydrolase